MSDVDYLQGRIDSYKVLIDSLMDTKSEHDKQFDNENDILVADSVVIGICKHLQMMNNFMERSLESDSENPLEVFNDILNMQISFDLDNEKT